MDKRQEHIDELISVFLSEGLNREEQDMLQAWMAESEENQAYFMKHQEIWFSALQENVSERYNEAKAFDVFRKRINRQQTEKHFSKKTFWKRYYKYAAAILVLGVVSYFSYWGGESHVKNALAEEVRVEAPLGSQTRLHLPDGTSVVLNAGSYITYPQDFGVDSRVVKLQGEGYFEVTHNEKQPFHVKTVHLQVRVLGTKFNFRDYLEDGEAVVSLLEGKIALKNQIRQEAELIVYPNERVTLDKQAGVMIKKSIKTKPDIQWMDGILIFDETPLSEVVKTLERCYRVRIIFSNEGLKGYRFYGSFNSSEQNIRVVLDAISATGKIKYKVENKDIVLY